MARYPAGSLSGDHLRPIVEYTFRLSGQSDSGIIDNLMRRTSLTPIQARQLGRLIRQHREARGLSIRGLAAASEVNTSSLIFLERGEVLSPQPDILRALAAALQLRVSDVFTVAGWLPADELPTLKPYLRTQYRGLDERTIAKFEQQIANELARKHGANHGPLDHEDETPD